MGRPTDYIVSTLNQMGMTVVSETLSKTEMESKTMAKDLGVTDTSKITEAFLSQAPEMTAQTVRFVLERNEAKKQLIVEETVNQTLTDELRLFSFVSTTQHDRLEALGAYNSVDTL